MSVSAEATAKIHVADDSREQLEALFDVISGSGQGGPATKKPGLPISFTREPSKLEKGANLHRKTFSEPAMNMHMRTLHDPLPPGWEIGRTEDGVPYYINHIEKRTQWDDPRGQVMGSIGAAAGLPPPEHRAIGQVNFLGHPSSHIPSPQPMLNSGGGYYPQMHHHMPQGSLDADAWRRDQRLHMPAAHHQYSQSYGGPMSRHVHPGHMSHYQHHGMHPHQGKRPFDSSLMEQKMPVGLHGDPYLSSSDHVRQASHDSGLGYPITPYQSEQIMDYEEVDNGSMHGNHMGSTGMQGVGGQLHPQAPPNRSIMEQLQGGPTPELGMDIDGSFQPPAIDTLPELNQENQYFTTGGAWV